MNTAQKIYRALDAEGLTDAGILGVILNLYAESGLRSTNVEDRSGIPDDVYTAMVDAGGYDFATDNGKKYGYGLAQWTLPSRKTALLKYAKICGVSIGDETMQIGFLIGELTTTPEYADLLLFLKATNSVERAADVFQRIYEHPAVITDRTRFLPQVEAMLAEGAAPPGFWPPRTLTAGMSGADVKALQGLLCARGWYDGPVNGEMDTDTVAAAAAFKSSEKLSKPETFGNKAWARLLKRET